MKKRKCFSRILTLFLFIGMILSSGIEVKALVIDFRLPSYIEIVVDKQEVTLGERVQIRIETSAKLSELGDEAYVAYINDGGLVKKVKEIKLFRDADSFVGDFVVDKDFINGLWKIDFVVLTKSDNNSVVVYNDAVHNLKGNSINHFNMSNGNILIKEFANYELFEDIAVSLNNVKMLDTEKITISANGENIALEKEAYALYSLENEFGVFQKEIKLLLNDNNNYIGEFVIDESFRPGVWKLNYIILKDKSGHREIVYNKELHGTTVNNSFRYLSKGNFTVERDMYGPVIGKFNKIRLNDIEEKYLITVEASDESKLYEKAYIKYVSKYNDKIIEQDVLLELVDGKYQGVFQRQDYNAWNVDFILFKDIEGNTTCVYNSELHDINSMNLSELNILADDKAPTIDRIEFKNLEIGGEMQITVIPSKDESQLSSKGYVLYETVDEDIKLEQEVVLNLQDGVYVGKFIPRESTKPLLWKISHVILSDTKNNIGIYYNRNVHGQVYNNSDFSTGDFNTSGEDAVGPTISEISIQSNALVLYDNESTKIKIKASDSSGLSDLAYVKYIGEGLEQEYKLTLTDGYYEGEITIDSKTPEGIMKVDYIIVKDKYNNTSIIYNSQIHNFGENLSAANISIENPELGMSILGVNVEKSVIEYGEEVGIEVKVSKGVFNLNDKAYLRYVQVENDMLTEKEIVLHKVDESTYRGSFNAENIRNLGNWKVDYVLLSDEKGNIKINYNNNINTIGTDISSGDIRVGDLVVHDVINSTIYKEVDFVSKFLIKNYGDTNRKITLVVEVRDIEGNLLSKFNVTKEINGTNYDVIDSRVKINKEAEFVNIYVLRENGDKLYDLLDNRIIE